MDTAISRLEQHLAERELTNEDVLTLAGCTLETHPGDNDNWIESVGGELPEYICEIARSIRHGGKTTSNSIQIAIGTVKRWAKGVGNVNADTRAKAAKAVAQWEALKLKAKTKK